MTRPAPTLFPMAWFRPIEKEHALARLIQLLLGLSVFGAGIGAMVESGLGLPPWDVLHQGLANQFGGSVGGWSIVVSFVVLLGWIPVREIPGVGTIANAIVVGLAIDLTTSVLPSPETAVAEWSLTLIGLLMVAVGSGLYINAEFGPGPRDGLMTGISKLGPSVRLTRFGIEATVLAIGWVLGGTVGIGTVLFAFGIGPLVQFFLRFWRWDVAEPS